MISLEPSAVATLRHWIEDDSRQQLAFRVSIHPGGCAGLRYEVILDDQRGEDDIVCTCDGIEVVCDSNSARYLEGATIGFSETGFKITNPNARSACMCGASFSPARAQ